MVGEAEKFASEDAAQRKRIEALNSLSSFVYGVKTQLNDQKGLGGKISDGDKTSLLATIKGTTEWIDENGSSTSVEVLEEKLAGLFYLFLSSSLRHVITPFSSEVQALVNSITSKLYSESGPSSGADDEEIRRDHDEL